MLLPKFGNLFLEINTHLFIFLFLIRINMLNKFDLFTLNVMDTIDLGKQGRVNSMIAKVAMKKDASFLKGATNPCLESFSRNKKFDMIKGKKPITISLSKR